MGKAMRLFSILLVVITASSGCASTSEVQPESVVASPSCPSLPVSVGAFAMYERRKLEAPARGDAFGFTDGSTDRATVFLYPLQDRPAADRAQDMVETEGAAWVAAFPIGVERGWYDAYEVAFADPKPIVLADRTIPGFAGGVPTRKDGSISVEVLYLFAVDGCMLKARGSLEGGHWMDSLFPKFAQDLAVAVATQEPPSE